MLLGDILVKERKKNKTNIELEIEKELQKNTSFNYEIKIND